MSAFLEAYEKIRSSNKEVGAYLNSNELSQVEKKFLEVLMKMMQDRPYEALQILKKTTPQNNFLKGFHAYLTGLVFNHLCSYEKAAKALVISIELFSNEDNKDLILKPINVVSHVYFNLRDLQRLEKYYQVFLEFKQDTDDHQILDYDYRIFIALLKEESQAVHELVDELFSKFPERLNRTASTYLVFRYMASVQIKDYDACYNTLEDYKSTVGFRIGPNYTFMLSLLNFMTKSAPVYVYQRDFKGSEYLYHQLKVIQSFQKANLDEAEFAWQWLSTRYPNLYLKDWNYRGGQDIFNQSLVKVRQLFENTELAFDPEQVQSLKSNKAKLLFILDHTQGYIDKDKLINLIWNEPWSPKNDGRLRTLISRVKKDSGLDIEVKDGKYKKVS